MTISEATPRFLRLPAVLAISGMSRSWVYKEMEANRFPRPIKIGATSVWIPADANAWADRVAAAGSRKGGGQC